MPKNWSICFSPDGGLNLYKLIITPRNKRNYDKFFSNALLDLSREMLQKQCQSKIYNMVIECHPLGIHLLRSTGYIRAYILYEHFPKLVKTIFQWSKTISEIKACWVHIDVPVHLNLNNVSAMTGLTVSRCDVTACIRVIAVNAISSTFEYIFDELHELRSRRHAEPVT